MDAYLVTGGAGFIGSSIVRKLVGMGHPVAVLDDLSTGRLTNLDGVLDSVRFVQGSTLDPQAVDEAMAGAAFVLHQAAVPSVVRSFEDPVRSHRVNSEGTLKVLQAARRHGVRRVVMASSSSVYGDTPTLPKAESMAPSPLSPYALTKLVGEHYGRIFTSTLELPVVNLRYFNVFGPRQDPASDYAAVIPKFVTLMSQGQRPVIFGDGEQSRDFCYIDNVIKANLLACHAPRAPGEVFNVAAGERTTLLQLVGMLNGLLGTDLEPVHEPARAGDVRHSQADVQHARGLLGFEVEVPFSDGLKATVDWYRNALAHT